MSETEVEPAFTISSALLFAEPSTYSLKKSVPGGDIPEPVVLDVDAFVVDAELEPVVVVPDPPPPTPLAVAWVAVFEEVDDELGVAAPPVPSVNVVPCAQALASPAATVRTGSRSSRRAARGEPGAKNISKALARAQYGVA